MWKLLAQSVAGSSHERLSQPCQDVCATMCESVSDETVLLLACADGAGSARFSDIGAASACEISVGRALLDLREGLPVAAIERDTVIYWLEEARKELSRESEQRQTSARELACTLLFAVVGEQSAAFAQIGDGAIVTRYGEEYRPVFWPQDGEYANCTNFLTQDDFADHLEFARFDERIDELALFSDGLQRLALNLAGRIGHRRFFEPFFVRLRHVAGGEELRDALRQFLESPRVAQRSDDDKTLILATRVPSRAEPTNPL
jgi:hypothetical protein